MVCTDLSVKSSIDQMSFQWVEVVEDEYYQLLPDNALWLIILVMSLFIDGHHKFSHMYCLVWISPQWFSWASFYACGRNEVGKKIWLPLKFIESFSVQTFIAVYINWSFYPAETFLIIIIKIIHVVVCRRDWCSPIWYVS